LPEHPPESGLDGYVDMGSLQSRYIVTNHKIERTTRVFSRTGSFDEARGSVKWSAAEGGPDSAAGGPREGESNGYVSVDLRLSPLPVAIGSPLRKALPELLARLETQRFAREGLST